jgi:leucyl-tRNA synthetase
MNGRLHLGHAFSLTKAEFTARFQRMLGKNVLFPFGFHCTGMPIQAAAVKLQEEIKEFGCPPVFPVDVPLEDLAANGEVESKTDEVKGKGKKTKLVAKGQAGGKIRQWDILSKMVPENEIPKFQDPLTWLNYFPPLGVQDLKKFGSCIDWRRSFITTAVNPYYDSFIRWQFNRLKDGGRIKSGYRPSIYSVKDQQVCADHDRASGEGVGPQEYVLIKLKVLDTSHLVSISKNLELSSKKVSLVAATLRPETMYGQTNCFVLPEGVYGAFEFGNEIFVMSERSAIGLAHQGYATEWGKVKCVAQFSGMDLIGLPLEPPLSSYRVVYTLPLITISMAKGTGVVTSVPSDAPDDYIALKELKEKPLWREKFGVTEEMVKEFVPLPIIGSSIFLELLQS